MFRSPPNGILNGTRRCSAATPLIPQPLHCPTQFDLNSDSRESLRHIPKRDQFRHNYPGDLFLPSVINLQRCALRAHREHLNGEPTIFHLHQWELHVPTLRNTSGVQRVLRCQRRCAVQLRCEQPLLREFRGAEGTELAAAG